MKIKVETENCDIHSYYLIEESADSKITLTIELERIVSVQSRKKAKDEIIQFIRSELKKFEWIISGNVLIDFNWYLNAVEKQETDKIGDIDNISKPIQDALIGPNGIIIDDSQIGGLYTSWSSRNEMIANNILRIVIRFNNDNALKKKNIKFIQYNAAMCMPVHFDKNDIKSLFTAKLLIRARNKIKNNALTIKKSGTNVDRYLICSDWDFHKSRLNAFDKKDILTLKELNKLCLNSGLDFKKIIELMKNPVTKTL